MSDATRYFVEETRFKTALTNGRIRIKIVILYMFSVFHLNKQHQPNNLTNIASCNVVFSIFAVKKN